MGTLFKPWTMHRCALPNPLSKSIAQGLSVMALDRKLHKDSTYLVFFGF